jgi:hypothetical protein
MIDWLTLKVCGSLLSAEAVAVLRGRSGLLMKIDPAGIIEWCQPTRESIRSDSHQITICLGGEMTVFSLGGAMRYASDQAAREDNLPTLWQTLKRVNKDEDVRRGLLMLVNLLAVLGRDVRYNRELMRAEG